MKSNVTNGNYSAFIKQKHNVDISHEVGKILELLAVEFLNGAQGNIGNCTSVKQLESYFDHNNISIQSLLSQLCTIVDEETRLYFFARWLMNIVDMICSGDGQDALSYVENNCDQIVIKNDCIKFLQKQILAKDDNAFIKVSVNKFFNKLLADDYFVKLYDEKLVRTFLNLWKIVRAVSPNDSPIADENKDIFSCILKRVSITNENLKIANLYELNLSYMDFSKTDLSETHFFDVNFSNCNFTSANLDSITWSGSNLADSDFESAFMECANLEDCDCQRASFKKAHLLSSVVSGANFSYVNLENANFMECDADRIKIKGMKINNKTAFNQTDLRYVDWEGLDISGLSINEDDVNHFWEIVNYTRNTILYDYKFKKLENQEVQDVIYKKLRSSADKYLSQTRMNTNVPDIFISYASEQKCEYAFPIYHELSDIKENGIRKHSIWIDEQQLTIGDKLRQSIESVLKYCKLVIVVFSDSYSTKGWTRYELYRIIQEYKERNLQIVILNLTSEKIQLDLFKEICSLVPNDNQYIGSDPSEAKLFVAKLAMKIL